MQNKCGQFIKRKLQQNRKIEINQLKIVKILFDFYKN